MNCCESKSVLCRGPGRPPTGFGGCRAGQLRLHLVQGYVERSNEEHSGRHERGDGPRPTAAKHPRCRVDQAEQKEKTAVPEDVRVAVLSAPSKRPSVDGATPKKPSTRSETRPRAMRRDLPSESDGLLRHASKRPSAESMHAATEAVKEEIEVVTGAG